MSMTAILVMWPESFHENFILSSHIGFIWNVPFISLVHVVSVKKDFKYIQPKWSLAKVNRWPWP